MRELTSFWCEITSGFRAPKIIEIGSFGTELFKMHEDAVNMLRE